MDDKFLSDKTKTATVTISDITYTYGHPCLICGEFIPNDTEEIFSYRVKICDKCRNAVMQMRKQLEDKGE